MVDGMVDGIVDGIVDGMVDGMVDDIVDVEFCLVFKFLTLSKTKVDILLKCPVIVSINEGELLFAIVVIILYYYYRKIIYEIIKVHH
jgi:hypothetical protein